MPHHARSQGIQRSVPVLLAAMIAAMLALLPAVWVVGRTPALDYLARHPGGRLVNAYEVSYGGGAFVVTLRSPAKADAAPDCPANWFCFWDETSYNGYRGKLSSCGFQSLVPYYWDYRVASAYYNLGQGAVQFRNGSTALFQIGVTNRAIPNAGYNSYWATTVYRYC